MLDITTELFVRAIQKEGGGVFFVGGCVRDELMGNTPKDYDLLVTGMRMMDLIKTLEAFGRVDLVGESFGVLKFKPMDATGKQMGPVKEYDIAIPRKEIKVGTGHTGFEVIASPDVTLEEDLNRRDFTINSMAMTLQGELIDYHGGLQDIKNKVIAITNPIAFTEDPLRVLRAFRFMARFDFIAGDYSVQLIRNMKSDIEKNPLPNERIFEEIRKTFESCNPIGLRYFKNLLIHFNYIDVFLGVNLMHKEFNTTKIKTLPEFIYYLYDFDSNSKMHTRGYLTKESKILDTLDSLVVLDKAQHASSEMAMLDLVVKAGEHAKIDYDTKMFNIPVLAKFKEGLPIHRKDLLINGNDLRVESGIDEGIRVGAILDKCFKAVLYGNIKNTKEELLWYVRYLKSQD